MIPAKPDVAYVGMEVLYGNPGPLIAFTDEVMAAYWCSRPEVERYVWPVKAIELGGPLLGVVIPENYELTPAVEIVEES